MDFTRVLAELALILGAHVLACPAQVDGAREVGLTGGYLALRDELLALPDARLLELG